MGNRLAEMQLRILWEEIMQRFDTIEVVGQPKKGLLQLCERLHPPSSETPWLELSGTQNNRACRKQGKVRAGYGEKTWLESRAVR